MVHLMEACLLTALQAYLLGSLLFGVLVSKLFYHDDVRLHGSGNAGMTNVLRTYGKLPAVITTIGDVGKSVVAVKLGQFIFDSLLSGTGLISSRFCSRSAALTLPPSSACWATASLSFLACAAAKACWLVPVLR